MFDALLPIPVASARETDWLVGTRLTSELLTRAERAALAAAATVRAANAHVELVREADGAVPLIVLTHGWAARYRTKRDGKRQITKILLPGDVINLDALAGGQADYGVRSITRVEVAQIQSARFRSLCDQHAGVARTSLRVAIADGDVASRWALVLGRYSSLERVAHLLCELSVRLAGTRDGLVSFDWPLTQEHVADALGLTTVHVNRMLRTLREAGLLTLRGRAATLPDLLRLRRVADFDPAYLCAETIDRGRPLALAGAA